ncbi:MAG: thioesterase, putative domain protein [Xanthomonadaceae bacterium]|nr:thioesterase, putative domain protein [Xanthomonadaceae bacterium]
MDPALASLATHYQAMPPVAALQLRIDGYDGECLQLHAPLSANVNDKGCAFGGSLASLMTLAGWGLVSLKATQAGRHADVFIADTQLRYRRPLYADLQAGARLAEGASWETFLTRLLERGRASVRIAAWVALPDGTVAAECIGRFVAISKG